jgi:hypothetical protein
MALVTAAAWAAAGRPRAERPAHCKRHYPSLEADHPPSKKKKKKKRLE